MTAIHLFDIVSRSNQWLSVRQATIASNVANANTPGYKALDVEPFEKVMESTRLSVEATQPEIKQHEIKQPDGPGFTGALHPLRDGFPVTEPVELEEHLGVRGDDVLDWLAGKRR